MLYKLKNILPFIMIIAFAGITATTQAQEEQAPAEIANGQVTLSLFNADIQDLVRWASSATQKTIIIHPTVKGKVTVVAGEPMSKSEAYQVFLSVLQVHGYVVVESDGALKVVPDKLGRESNIPLADSGSNSGLEDMVVQVFKVNNMAVGEVLTIIRPMVPQTGHLAAYPSTNSLLVAARSGKIQQIAKIIAKLDTAGSLNIEMVPIEFASARDLSQTLGRLIPQAKGKNSSSALTIAVDERSNSILLTGDPGSRKELRKIIKRLDQPLPGEGNTQVIFLQYAQAKDLVPILESVGGSAAKEGKDQKESKASFSIRADESLNSIVVTATPSVLSTIKGVIAKLDVRRAQVLVKAMIVEVNEDFTRDLGIEWRALSSEGNTEITTGISNFPNNVNAAVADVGGLGALGQGLSVGFFRGGDLRGVIRALEGDSDANVLSTPTILAMDNEEASILVGETVPFITGSQNRQGNTDPFQTIQRKDIGVTLKIKPRINNSDSVTLEIEQSVESIAQTTAATADIVTSKREIKTRALVDDNQVLVLGGLIRDEMTETESKVPILGSIPVVGRAFRSTNSSLVKRNLMVFIHPVILRDSRKSLTVSRDRYDYMRERQDALQVRMEGVLVPGTAPRLPELPTATPTEQSER
ncbi:type II secretion system secretin GspD [Pseudoteredinibacter isoporae]|uniref:type II secretion system secretin GspD n=1 Tax=Pseudoteredinibacter isoporae TaxID=570281 RepID=UPI00310A76C8